MADDLTCHCGAWVGLIEPTCRKCGATTERPDMHPPEPMRAIVEELAARDPLYEDSDDGEFCGFCRGRRPLLSRGPDFRLGDFEHEPDCLWVRAKEAAGA